ncbi:MAG: B12-binding domain-containing radical SAM protein [Chlorobium phaeobacteroides]|uniref:Radical SAM domain protein n=1 Tax=Chlorobium phaeobacteroides (strain BS1) TaxID=331678 RepID=B3EPG0_CHLPB|nr:B12-binding domain-containing radical SAM protein [Chlorobium phaeobacteroides]
MKAITLVSYPTATDFDSLDTLKHIKYLKAPPFSILVVTSLFRRLGVEVNLFNTDNEYLRHLDSGKDAKTFCEDFAGLLAESAVSVAGFSSICNSYYVTLAIARELKRKRPEIRVLLGGTHATATAMHTMERCSYIDFILAGEIEDSLESFSRCYDASPEDVPGLYWRDSRKTIRVNTFGPPPNLEDMPLPAYDLCDDYNLDSFMVEAGRGCPFHCRFCSTSHFFGRAYRLRPFDTILDEASVLNTKFGFPRIALLHDNLFHSHRKLLSFCRKWKNDSRTEGLSWNCSLRADSISPEIAEELSNSGCESVFIGVETGSQRVQQVIEKRLKIDKVRQVIDSLHKYGVRTTVAFMIGFPEERREEVRLTLDFYYEMLCRRLASPQIDMLSPVNGSNYYEEYKEELYYDELTSAMAHQGDMLSSISAHYDDMVRASPELFAAHYALPLKFVEREFVFECTCFLRYAAYNMRWLLVMAVHAVGDLYDVVELFLEYRKSTTSSLKGMLYYSNYDFLEDFLAFAACLPQLQVFRQECLDQYRFMLDAYSLSDEEFTALKEMSSVQDVNRSCTLTLDDRLFASCLTKFTRYSFSEVVDSFDKGDPVENIAPMQSAIILRADSEHVFIEGVSVMTAAIVMAFEEGEVIANALEMLAEKHADLLPGSVANVRQGFLFAIQQLVATGYLRPD